MNKRDGRTAHNNLTAALTAHFGHDQAMKKMIGGHFEAVGIMEREILIQCGLAQQGYVIDVGCGSGRLAKPLSDYLQGKYLGLDVVPELINYARTLVNRPDWRFEIIDGYTIPEQDQTVDIVCFFSVFTHLLHEETYIYLREAKRVLKSGGKIIFSFLEFTVAGHWDVFIDTVEHINKDVPLNVFMSRDAITTWAHQLDLEIEAIHSGDQAFISLPHPVTLDNNTVVQDQAALGQSVCVLVKQ